MKKILLLMILVAALTSPAFALRAAIVVENTGAVGVDTMLSNIITQYLGYTVTYFDIDNIGSTPGTYNSAYFVANFDVVILCGTETAIPTPTTQADSICNAPVGVVAIGQDFWDETNLGTTTSNSNGSSGRFKNLGRSHWITRVFADTIQMYTAQAVNQYGVATPDSIASTGIVPLLIGTTYGGDTSRCMAVAADSGARVFGTSGGPAGSHFTKGRRVFCGFFQNTVVPDTCQFTTLMARAIAWAAKDTLNDLMMKNICFSGRYELDLAHVVENSSGTDSIECYGTYSGLNLGQDSEEKHCFIKIKNSAMQRKVGSIYRALDVSRATLRLGYEATSFNNSGTLRPTTFNNSITFQPIIQFWQTDFRFCIHSGTCPNACWTYAWLDTAANPDVEYAWGIGGARSYTTDTRDLKYDTLTISESTPTHTFQTIDLHPDTLGTRMLDTLKNFGWASRMISYAAEHDDPVGDAADYGEMSFYAVGETNAISGMRGLVWPSISVLLSSWSTTIPTPTIAIATPSYDDDSVVFVGTYGQTFSPQEVVLSNSQGGALECATISDNSGGWLYLVASGTNMPITLNVYMIGQQVGYRSATITITCADASNSPRTIKVASLLTSASARPATGKEIWR